MLKFGILLNSESLTAWQQNVIDELHTSQLAQLEFVVINATGQKKRSSKQKLKKFFGKSAWFPLFQHFSLNKASFNQTKPLDKLHNKVEKMDVQVIKKGKYSEYFEEADTQVIKEKNLDFLLRFGFGILKGDVLNSAKYGIWSFHHGNPKGYKGGPPGFWEIYNGSNTSGVLLQRLTEKLDAGVLLKYGEFKSINYSYKKNLEQLFSKSAKWPAQICRSIVTGASIDFENNHIASSGPINKFPSNLQFASFIFKLLRNKIKKTYAIFGEFEVWTLGIAKQDEDFTFLKRGNYALLKDLPNNCFYADPFIFEKDNEYFCIFEDFSYKDYIGKLSIAKIDLQAFKQEKVLKLLDKKTLSIPSKKHLAYPYLVRQEELYCIPETAEENEAALYSIDVKNKELIKRKTLVSGFPAVDTSIVKYENKWWLFCTNANDFANENLYIYHADDLLGDWKAHANNPVKNDISGSRPGGKMFIKNGELYRPVQDSSVTYGGQLKIFKIKQLSESSFHEEFDQTISPKRIKKFNKALHTLSFDEEYIIFDCKRHVFNWAGFKQRIKTRILKKS